MSKKPLKAGTRKKLEAAMQKKQKRIEELHRLPPYTVIFSEGIKTEPFYILGLTQQINKNMHNLLPEIVLRLLAQGETLGVF